ncbi:MAG TPA: hypothetical protein VJZ17_01915 [Nitrosopumilaceae archaeon]|nr:hypothetical protein [Nitrosopumilaceae archaeon]
MALKFGRRPRPPPPVRGYGYGRGHGKGKPPKNLPPIMPIPPPIEPSPPPIDDGMAKDCFGDLCGRPKPVRKRNRVTFVTRGVQGIRRY